MNKFKFLFIAALLVFGIATTNEVAFGWGAASGDGTYYGMLQETAVFVNNSGGELSAGDVVVIDTTATAGSTLGAYVTTTTSADDILAVGVVKSRTSADGTPVVVVTKGPVDTRCADGNDAVSSGSAVGTYTTAKKCGGGTNLGIALEAGDGADDDLLFVWVSPTGAD